jgi:hypothetical protein
MAITGFALSGVAIALGRIKESARSPGITSPVRYAGFGIYPSGGGDGIGLLDRATGRVERVGLPREIPLDNVICSPWRDPEGELELVGRLRAPQNGSAVDGYSLVRVTFPTGRILDRAAIGMLPDSPPCCVPGRTRRVLFTANDGCLYHLAFSDSPGQEPAAPRPVRWPGSLGSVRRFRMSGPVWAAELALARHLLIVIEPSRAHSSGTIEASKLGWLELNPDGTEIVAAGRLTTAGASPISDGAEEERYPAVGRAGAEGIGLVAFLARTADESAWTLLVAPLRNDPAGAPVVVKSSARVLATDCAPAAPSISFDGRWVAYVRKRDALSAIRGGLRAAVAPTRVRIDGPEPAFSAR